MCILRFCLGLFIRGEFFGCLFHHFLFAFVLVFRILAVFILFVVFVLVVLVVYIVLIAESRSILRLCLALNIDLIAGELGCKTGVLAFSADGQRELIIRYHDLGSLLFRICEYRNDLGG